MDAGWWPRRGEVASPLLVAAAVGVSVVLTGMAVGVGVATADDERSESASQEVETESPDPGEVDEPAIAEDEPPPDAADSGDSSEPIDAENVTLIDGSCEWVTEYLSLPGELTLEDGEVPNLDMGAWIAVHDVPPITGDLDDDGTDETLVPIICTAGGSGFTIEVHIFDAEGEDLGFAEVGATLDYHPSASVETLDVVDGRLVVTGVSLREGEPTCCGTLQVEETYELTDSGVELVDQTTS